MVKNGIDCIGKYEDVFRGKRLGLITSVSGVDCNLISSIERLHKTYGLTALFAPEHGVRGDAGAGECVDTYVDEDTGLTVYSLYRKDSKRLTEEMLSKVDAVIYDIADVGSRYYTFISTMINAMEDCAKWDKELIVLDRFNPLGGAVEGNCLRPGFESFVGRYSLCMRYGMTAGEVAAMVNREQNLGCRLTVIPCEGWTRDMLFPDTGNIWVMPSLGMPRFETALLYPGTCFFEGTNVSEGRGTAAPFEIIGASYIKGARLAEQMQAQKLPGVMFSPAYFRPSFSKFEGEDCQGVHIHVTDARRIRPCETGLRLLFTIREMYGEEFSFLPPHTEGGRPFMELLYGSDALTQGKMELNELLLEMERDAKAFAERAAKYAYYGRSA